MSIKSDKWIRRMAEQHGMIEPFEPGQVRAIPAGGAPYLVMLISRIPSQIPPLKQVEPKAREAYIRSVAESDARAEAQIGLSEPLSRHGSGSNNEHPEILTLSLQCLNN